MANWPTAELGEVIDLFDSQRVPLNSRQRLERQGSYPYYGAQGVIDYIDDYIFDGRYILVAEDGENLNSKKLPLALVATGKFWVNNHAHILRGKLGIADDTFLLACLNNADIKPFVTGAAQPKLSQGNLRRIQIPLPPLPIQRRIAGILSAYDELIENSQRRIKILESMARGLYREWFVHFRFPGHESVPRVPSPLGEIPKGWEVGRLDDVLVLQRGFDLPKASRIEGTVPIIAATGITGFHNEARAKAPGVVTGRSGTIGEVLYVQEDFWPLNTSLWVKEFPNSEPLYAFYLLSSLDLKQFNSGAAVPTLNRNDIHGTNVVVPPRSIQKRFQDFTGSMLAKSRTLDQQIQNLRRTRDLLLPRLLSGQINVETIGL
jgi:type I restriction enzyme S subunit